MKLKNILKYLFIAVLAMQLASCDNKEDVDPIFDQTPTERLNAQKKELNDLLESSEFGWKAVYFTDTTQLGGFTHLFKFKSGSVDMASDFDNDTAIYKSEYGIELGSTVSLVFTTKNKIKNQTFNFQNKLKFKHLEDLTNFYKSTIFYNKKSQNNLINFYRKEKLKSSFFKIIKSAKLYKFSIKN